MHPSTNLSVLSFFLFGTFSFAVLSVFYLKQKDAPFRLFGLALVLIALAFAVWSYVVYARPANLELITTIGVAPFVLAFGVLFAVSASSLKGKHKIFVYIFSALFVTLFALLRVFFYGSNPAFDDKGFFYFNADPVILYLYVLAISFSILPAVYVLGRQIKNITLRIVMELGFTLIAIGTIVLIISYDDWLQVINGWGMIIVLIILLLTHLTTRFKDKSS